jgi:hypothetical protein
MSIVIWDPRKGEDYLLDNFDSGQTFSSLNANVCAAEIHDITEDKLQQLLLHFSKLPDELSIVISPWSKRRSFEECLPRNLDVEYSGKNILVRGIYTIKDLDLVLAARVKLGGGESGEWLFIGSRNKIKFSQQEINESFNILLERVDEFEFLLFSAEMCQTFLFYKPTVWADKILSELGKNKSMGS